MLTMGLNPNKVIIDTGQPDFCQSIGDFTDHGRSLAWLTSNNDSISSLPKHKSLPQVVGGSVRNGFTPLP